MRDLGSGSAVLADADRKPCGSAARPAAGGARISNSAAGRRSPSAVGHATTGTTIANFYPRRAYTGPRASYMPTMMSSRYRRC